MTTIATPAVGADLIAKIIALAGADFPTGRVFADGEDPVGALATDGEVTWVKFVAEVVDDYDANGSIRAHTFQIKRRCSKPNDPKAAKAFAAMTRLYDALNKTRAWTGASAAVYLDLFARTFPTILEERYVVMDVVVEFDTLST